MQKLQQALAKAATDRGGGVRGAKSAASMLIAADGSDTSVVDALRGMSVKTLRKAVARGIRTAAAAEASAGKRPRRADGHRGKDGEAEEGDRETGSVM